MIGQRSGDGELDLSIVVSLEGGAREGDGAAIVGRMFGAADKTHVLADVKERYVEGGNIDDIVKANFGAGGDDHFHAANTGYGALCRTVPEGDERRRIIVRTHGVKKVSRIDHVPVGAAVDYEYGGAAVSVPV